MEAYYHFTYNNQDVILISIVIKKRAVTRMIKTVVPKSKWIPDKLFQDIQRSVPVPCLDILVLRKGRNRKIETLLIKRKIYPDIGRWCTIGGRILKNELTKDALRRQAKREFGISVKIIKPWNEINPFAVYNDPRADKQKHFVDLTFPVIISGGKIQVSGPEYSEARWFPLNNLPVNMGFHFRRVFRDFKKTKIQYKLR